MMFMFFNSVVYMHVNDNNQYGLVYCKSIFQKSIVAIILFYFVADALQSWRLKKIIDI